jgi:hypothetical protein
MIVHEQQESRAWQVLYDAHSARLANPVTIEADFALSACVLPSYPGREPAPADRSQRPR